MDWASRSYGDNSFEGMPVAIMSASTSILSGARAQYQLRQTFVFLDMHPINRPEIFVGQASQKLDENGKLLDDKAKELMKTLFDNLGSDDDCFLGSITIPA